MEKNGGGNFALHLQPFYILFFHPCVFIMLFIGKKRNKQIIGKKGGQETYIPRGSLTAQ